MVEETGNWTPQELAAVLRKWEHVGPRLCGRAADMIEAQAAFLNEHAPSLASKDEEIARLKAELAEESGWVSRHLLADAKTRAAIGEEFCLVPPDGGDVKTWKAAAALRARASSLEAQVARLREALEWYASPSIYKPDSTMRYMSPDDLARKARATLAKLNALERNEDGTC